MWIKHNKALYNIDEMTKIFVARTKLKARYPDGTEVILGEFRATKECEDILSSVTRGILGGEKLIIIRDTKEKKKV